MLVQSRRAHRHVCLPAKMMPVEGDGGVVEQRVLVKVAVQHGDRPSAALQRCAPDLRHKVQTFGHASEYSQENVDMDGFGLRVMRLCRRSPAGLRKGLQLWSVVIPHRTPASRSGPPAPQEGPG